MKRRAAAGTVLAALTCSLALGGGPARAQAPLLHGENAVFSTEGLVVAWAVLRGATEETTQVLVRLVVRGGRYGYVAVDGVDPFRGARRAVLAGAALADVLDVRSPRASFADFPRREIRLYRTAADWRRGAPALTVYYLGVPDTTPEFASEAALAAYLADAVARSR